MVRRVGLLSPEMCSKGGVQTFMWRITEALARLREERLVGSVSVYSLNDTPEQIASAAKRFPGVAFHGGGGSRPRTIGRMAIGPQLDFLIVGHIGPAQAAPFLKWSGRVGRYAVVLHGIEAWDAVSPLRRLGAMEAERIIATTDFTRRVFADENSVPPGRFVTIPLCVHPGPSVDLGSPPDRPGLRLLCVARLDAREQYKGVDHVLAALASLDAAERGVTLEVVGDGTDRPRLEQMATDLGLGAAVTFRGAVDDRTLSAAYDACDAFVMPSLREGFGIVFLEAMRLGKPCIGGRHGGTPEVIEDGVTGFLVQYGDVPGLGQCIEALLHDPSLRWAMGRAGLARVEARFGFDQFTAGLLAVMASKTGG